MSKQKTFISSNERKRTIGFEEISKSYVDSEEYLSKKSSNITENFVSEKKYISGSESFSISTSSTRSFDKMSDINERLKKLAR